MFNLDKLTAHFEKPYEGADKLGSLYVSRQAQAFFATREKDTREALNADYAKLIVKAARKVEEDGKAVNTPVVFTDLFSLGLSTKLEDRKIDGKKLIAAIRAEFGCSEERAKKVADAGYVRPVKTSLVIQRLV